MSLVQGNSTKIEKCCDAVTQELRPIIWSLISHLIVHKGTFDDMIRIITWGARNDLHFAWYKVPLFCEYSQQYDALFGDRNLIHWHILQLWLWFLEMDWELMLKTKSSKIFSIPVRITLAPQLCSGNLGNYTNTEERKSDIGKKLRKSYGIRNFMENQNTHNQMSLHNLTNSTSNSK